MRKSKFRKGLVVAIIVLFIGASVVPSACSNIRKKVENLSPLESGLVAYWNFDEGTGNILHDVSGNGNDGTITGANWTTGISGYGLEFNGDDFTNCGNTLTGGVLSEVTVASFVNGNNSVSYGGYILYDGSDGEFCLEISGITKYALFRVKLSDGLLGYGTYSVSNLSSEDWYHIVGTYNYTDAKIKIYVNGQLENTTDIPQLPLYDPSGAYYPTIGAYSSASDTHHSYFNGIIDEVRVYNKELNAEEIQYLYENPGVGDIVYVDDDFDENTTGWQIDHFDKIQDGVDAVNENGTVYVYNGTYYENVVIDKTINLTGEDRNTTIIDASGSGNVVNVNADNVNITKFTIKNSGSNQIDAGIKIHSDYNYIFNNIFKSNNGEGVSLKYSNHNMIKDNIIDSNNDNGILIWDSNNNIVSNTISSNNYVGIRFSDSSGNNILSNCNISDNDHGIIIESTITNNIVVNCTVFSNNYKGIGIEHSGSHIILNNTISNNYQGISIGSEAPSNGNVIYHNNLINNTVNAVDECGNTWNDSYPSGGNYWSDYTGDDLHSGPNQDIPGPDGIGDTPYDITGGANQDQYPLMHPFEMYYILNISAPSEVNEGELFNVVVTSRGGPVVPLATVEFNDELKFTDSDGRVYFIAPLVETDTYYDINATKEGYTGDTETILIKDVPGEFISTFIFGRLDNLTTEEEIITFEALNIRARTFFPFTFNHYTSGELLTISKDYFGLVGARFIFAFCGLAYQSSTSKISMNKFSQDDFANTVIWLVSGVEGNPVETKDVEMILLNESGQPQPDAEITFNEATGEGYINPGDTFTVVAPSDGYYVFMLTHKISGATIYKGSLTHY